MASWVPIFKTHLSTQMEIQAENYIPYQLSTIGLDGFPKNRTVVHRGFLFDDETNSVLTFTTDKRMGKYDEILADDRIEAVFNMMGAKRQFRFKGRAKIIDDELKPEVELHDFKPRSVGTSESDSSDSESESEEPDSTLVFKAKKLQINPSSIQTSKNLIRYNLISPGLVQTNNENNSSYVNLSEMADVVHPPTEEEYNQEITRQWDQLSKSMKKSFRKPAPKSPMDASNSKLIDSIKRGVDGKKDIDGRKNFAVIALFIESVDYFDNENDKRYVFEKDKYDMWKEYEVCP